MDGRPSIWRATLGPQHSGGAPQAFRNPSSFAGTRRHPTRLSELGHFSGRGHALLRKFHDLASWVKRKPSARFSQYYFVKRCKARLTADVPGADRTQIRLPQRHERTRTTDP